MKAIVTTRYGPPEVLELRDIAKPPIRDDEILVRVHAASINPVDWKVRSGRLRIITGWKPMPVLGSDYAGVVAEVGKRVTSYKVGDQVWGKVSTMRGGAYAEFLKVKKQEIGPKPKNLGFEEAAAVPLAGLTAYQALLQEANVKRGDSVLINGCSGGVGHMAVQIAKALGCHVTGVCSTKNLQFAKDIGADEVIDYTKEDPLAQQGAYDTFFDAIGKRSFPRARPTLKAAGTYVTTLPSFQILVFGPLNNVVSARKAKKILVKHSTQDLTALEKMAESGELRPTVEHVYPLEQVRAAHARSETGRVVGKIVLKIT